jgi:hypothetical protein
VVNKSVADRAVAVQADELVRKPFQPQELIGRVKNLLLPAAPAGKVSGQEEHPPVAVPSLTGLFASQPAPQQATLPPQPKLVPPVPLVPAAPATAPEARPADAAWPRALAEAFIQQNSEQPNFAPQLPAASPASRPPALTSEVQKLRAEITRLDLLVKKLQTELQIERQYNQSLELHVRSLIQID